MSDDNIQWVECDEETESWASDAGYKSRVILGDDNRMRYEVESAVYSLVGLSGSPTPTEEARIQGHHENLIGGRRLQGDPPIPDGFPGVEIPPTKPPYMDIDPYNLRIVLAGDPALHPMAVQASAGEDPDPFPVDWSRAPAGVVCATYGPGGCVLFWDVLVRAARPDDDADYPWVRASDGEVVEFCYAYAPNIEYDQNQIAQSLCLRPTTTPPQALVKKN